MNAIDANLYDPGLFFDDDGRVYVFHGQGKLLAVFEVRNRDEYQCWKAKWENPASTPCELYIIAKPLPGAELRVRTLKFKLR